jgi:hypothetical protein
MILNEMEANGKECPRPVYVSPIKPYQSRISNGVGQFVDPFKEKMELTSERKNWPPISF